MKKFKHAALALATAGLLSAQAHAGETQVENRQALPVAAFSQADIDAMFEQADKPMQLAALSDRDMKETEGAIGPWGAAAGALVGGIAEAGYQLGRLGAGHEWSWRSVGRSAAIGAMTGFTGGSAAAWYLIPRAVVITSVVAGRAGW
ncbi:hypothetical protein D8B23_10520 [Verminephrobacter aporrectodeae subsp. tuberculatae]|uniref:hypothetical protein n=1 Tax=Verminephrobacter aporrectodeae TaxID=1110389 RepID=UPI0022431F11|nr:hypothetical protein [Verminephrobacter aporrectodeae]MCW8198847.1 hypothetical protein [Verminephrobacter aporrectodeae subsp. tuberculatae]